MKIKTDEITSVLKKEIASFQEKLDLAEYLHERLLAMPEIEIVSAPELTTVAFRKRTDGDSEAENRALLDRINAGKQVYLSPTILKGAFVLRVSILSHRTHRAEVDQVIEEITRSI